jgi:hypothetical protein
MKQLPLRHEPRSLVKAANPHTGALAIAWDRLVTTITDPDLATVTALSVIGLLIALNLMLRFPDVGAIIEQYNQF